MAFWLSKETGLIHSDHDRSLDGFTNVSTFRGESACLIDHNGAEVRRWNLPEMPGSLAYLLPNGNCIFRAFRYAPDSPELAGGLNWQ